MEQNNPQALAALQAMRQKMMMPPSDLDPGTTMAHNMAVNGTNPVVATLAGTARNMRPDTTAGLIWDYFFGNKEQPLTGGQPANDLAQHPENY